MDILRILASEILSILLPLEETITIWPFWTVTLRTVLMNRSVLMPSLVSIISLGLSAGSDVDGFVSDVDGFVVVALSVEGSLGWGCGCGCGVTLVLRRRPLGRVGRVVLAGGSGRGAGAAVSVLDSVSVVAVVSVVVSVRAEISGSGSSMRAPDEVTRRTPLSVRSEAVGVAPVSSAGVAAAITGSDVPAELLLYG